MRWRIARWLAQRRYHQRTFCYCPGCERDLVSSHSFLDDDGNVVRYRCSWCGTPSRWLFNCVVPLLLDVPAKAKQLEMV